MNKKKLLLFDLDGTLTESGEVMNKDNIITLNNIAQIHDIGIVGGGKFEKICDQTNGVKFNYYFSECGCVYHDKNLNIIYKKNIRFHPLYPKINILIKKTLKFLSEVDYEITGNFIDLRNGIVYISLIGMSATATEREKYMYFDNIYNYRKKLLNILIETAKELGIDKSLHIVQGGSVGIAIYPNENDKIQILNILNLEEYSEIHYFGDKYMPNGNDYLLLNHEKIIGHNIDTVEQTFKILSHIL